MKQETYKEAHDRIFNYCKGKGWKVSDNELKVRWVERPGDGKRFWFRTQSIWVGKRFPVSTFMDVRGMEETKVTLCFSVL